MTERVCFTCNETFEASRPAQVFCSSKCRHGWHTDRGALGRVVQVSRTAKGARVVMAFGGPATEAAMQLTIGQAVRAVPYQAEAELNRPREVESR